MSLGARDFSIWRAGRTQCCRGILLGFLGGILALVSKADSAEPISFNRDVRPILSSKCFACHGPDEHAREADLRLDTPAGATADLGGKQAVKPNHPEASELVRRITSTDPDERMPPANSNKTLTSNQIETLRQWIAQGGEYEPHWAFVSPTRPRIPDVLASVTSAPPGTREIATKYDAWPRNAIDEFTFERMLQAGLTPSPDADRYTLVRRLYLDLLGLLPPTEELDAFVHDRDPLAYERLVDRLLGSPHYGERWARRWLDLARYADTNGYEKDRPRNIWPYRDWVIRALNADKPFDQFSIEQLAGDMLPNPTDDQLVATGFHRNTMLNEEGGIDPLEFRFHAMTDRVGTTATTWMALTMNCCQCHTHKYDPIVHHEYYQVMALLNNADEPDLDLTNPDIDAAYRRQLADAERLLSQLPDKWPVKEQRDPKPGNTETPPSSPPVPMADAKSASRQAAQQAFATWLKRERDRTVIWKNLRPKEAKSNLPLLTVQADDSIFASGDISKDDTYELLFDDVPAGVTAIRLEVLPDDRLPAHGPGMTYYEGPKGDFFLGELQLFNGGRQLVVAQASESYAKNNFGSNPVTASLATDGDPQTGWSCAGRFGEPHQAVFVLREPITTAAIGTPIGTDLKGNSSASGLKIKMRFGRHYACSLGRFRISVTTAARGAAARDLSRELEAVLELSDDQLNDVQREQLWKHFLLTAPELAADAKRIRELQQRPESPTTLVLHERSAENSRPTFRHHRGEYLQPRERVTPDVPAFLPRLPANATPNRLNFARWLVSPSQPLTGRVVVNRQWAALFGQGLVRTQGDFGFQGESPSHPELLDWLTVEFVEGGWSLKQLHRLIVTSSTYRQSSHATTERLANDPSNRWLARGPRVRIDAEVVRDVALGASGLLSEKMFGPPVRPPQPEGVTEAAYGGGKWPVSQGEDRYRRGIYTFSKRTAPYAMFNTFDAPSGEVCLAQRETSNTPLQSLTLLNDEVFVEAARRIGANTATRADDDEAKIRFLFQRCLTRPPNRSETVKMLAFVRTQRERFTRGELNAAEVAGTSKLPAKSTESVGPGNNSVEHATWTTLARVLLNLDESITKQ